jgi:hypothetical protein
MAHAGLTALHETCTVGHLEVVKALVEDSRAMINLIDDENMTALDLANGEEVFDYLTTKKALLNDEILERGHEFHEIDATIELKLKQFNEKYQTNLSLYTGDSQEVLESDCERTDSEIDTVMADSGGEDRNLKDFEDFATPLDMHKSTVPLAKLMDEMMDWD